MRRACPSGFTLIEVAIVIVIIGLLLAGVLKGQELLIGARVRSILQQQNSLQAAYYGFLGRFRAPPGDYAQAAAMISGVSNACGVAGNPGSGDGNGRIEAAHGEYILVWEHLSKSGFLTNLYTCSGNAAVGPGSTPRNAYGEYLQLIYDNNYALAAREQHNLKTGNNMPSNIVREIDRKIDDGIATQGSFRGSTFTTSSPTDAGCWDAGSGLWGAEPVFANCGGTTLF